MNIQIRISKPESGLFVCGFAFGFLNSKPEIFCNVNF